MKKIYEGLVLYEFVIRVSFLQRIGKIGEIYRIYTLNVCPIFVTQSYEHNAVIKIFS